MKDNERRKKDRHCAQNKAQRHIQFEEVTVPQVHEPLPLCAICNKPIETIADAISEPDGGYSHFDCVLDKIREQEHVTDDEKLSYIGHGSFAVFIKDKEGKYVIKTRIPYESKESYEAAKKFVESAKE